MHDLITVAEAAKYLRKRKSYVYESIYKGRLKAIKTGPRGLRITQQELEEFLASLEAGYYSEIENSHNRNIVPLIPKKGDKKHER